MTNFQYFGDPKWIFKIFFLNIGIYEYKKIKLIPFKGKSFAGYD